MALVKLQVQKSHKNFKIDTTLKNIMHKETFFPHKRKIDTLISVK